MTANKSLKYHVDTGKILSTYTTCKNLESQHNIGKIIKVNAALVTQKMKNMKANKTQLENHKSYHNTGRKKAIHPQKYYES